MKRLLPLFGIWFISMKRFVAKRFLLPQSFNRMLVCFLLFASCNEKNNPSKEVTDVAGRKYYRINLFSEDKTVEGSEGVSLLSFQEASKLSESVLLTSAVQKIDSAVGRGLKPFFLYKVNKGRLIKPAASKEIKDAIYFIAKENLFNGRVYKDSAYLFLAPLTDYHILKTSTGIKYHWVDKAPFSKDSIN